MVKASHLVYSLSLESYSGLYTHVNLCSLMPVHVAQWLEHLTGHEKVTGCTHI